MSYRPQNVPSHFVPRHIFQLVQSVRIYDIITLLEVGLMKYDGKRQRLNAIFKQIEKDMHEGVFTR